MNAAGVQFLTRLVLLVAAALLPVSGGLRRAGVGLGQPARRVTNAVGVQFLTRLVLLVAAALLPVSGGVCCFSTTSGVNAVGVQFLTPSVLPGPLLCSLSLAVSAVPGWVWGSPRGA